MIGQQGSTAVLPKFGVQYFAPSFTEARTQKDIRTQKGKNNHSECIAATPRTQAPLVLTKRVKRTGYSGAVFTHVV